MKINNKNIFKQINPILNMIIKGDKRGQEGGMGIGTIIALILGLALLVVIIYGFVVGWNNFLPFISSGNNVDSIVNLCQVACSTSGTSTYGYCTQNRTLQAPDLPNDAAGKKVSQVYGTCNSFSTLTNNAGKSYGIAPCPAITCP